MAAPLSGFGSRSPSPARLEMQPLAPNNGNHLEYGSTTDTLFQHTLNAHALPIPRNTTYVTTRGPSQVCLIFGSITTLITTGCLIGNLLTTDRTQDQSWAVGALIGCIGSALAFTSLWNEQIRLHR